MQIADAGSFKCARERVPDAFVRSDLGAVNRQIEIRVRTQERGNLLRFRLVDVQLVCQKRGIVQLEAVLHLLPRPGLRRRLPRGRHSLRDGLRRPRTRAQRYQ